MTPSPKSPEGDFCLLYNVLNYLLIVFDSICTVFGSVTIYVVDNQYKLFREWLQTVTDCLPAGQAGCSFIVIGANKCFGF